MTYSNEWDAVYARGEQLTRWPWSDLVSAVKRYCGDLTGKRVLELGCGVTIPNAQFFLKEGAKYSGIEGNRDTPEGVISGDFTYAHYQGPYDLICDRAAVTHNDIASIKRCLELVRGALVPGGYYIGIDWFSTLHDDRQQFEGVGTTTFFSADDLCELYSAFKIVSLEHKIVQRVMPRRGQFASWDIVARRR